MPDIAGAHPQTRPWPLRALVWMRRNPAPTAWTVVVLAALTWWVWPPLPDGGADAAERKVREYLEAVRDGDTERALGLANLPPALNDTPFLSPDVLDPAWTIERIDSGRDELDTADYINDVRVDVLIAGPDGTTAQGVFELERHDGGPWVLLDPLVRVEIPLGPLWYVEVNGVTAPWPVAEKETDLDGDPSWVTPQSAPVTLFPGVYRFYSDVPGLATVASGRVPLLPGGPYAPLAGLPMPDGFDLTLTEESDGAVQAAVDAYLDRCVRAPIAAVDGCPFGSSFIHDGGEVYYDAKNLHWTIDEYPVVAAVAGARGIPLADRRHGTATLHGTDRSGAKELSMTCEVNVDRLNIVILPGGELRAVPDGWLASRQLRDFTFGCDS